MIRAASWVLLLVITSACESGDSNGGGGQGGSSASGGSAAGQGGSGGGDASGGSSGMSASGGSGGSGGVSASGGMGGASGASIDGGSGGMQGAGQDAGGDEALVGVCGVRGEATVNATTFSGFVEHFIIADEGFGDDICVVRLEVERVGDAPEGCGDPTANVDCLWAHAVEHTNPMVMLDVDGACASSDLALDADAIAALDDTSAAYGFVSEFAGHNSVLLKHDAASGDWIPFGNGTWDEETEMFRFDQRDGLCEY